MNSPSLDLELVYGLKSFSKTIVGSEKKNTTTTTEVGTRDNQTRPT